MAQAKKYGWIDDSKWYKPAIETDWFKNELKELGYKTKEDWLNDLHMAWGPVFDETVKKFPDREAVIFKGERWTWKQFAEKVNNFAKGLLKIGVKKGSHVGQFMDNNNYYFVAQVACWKIGAWSMGIDARYRPAELEYALAVGDIDTLVMDPAVWAGRTDALAMLMQAAPELEKSKPGQLSAKKLPALKRVILHGAKKDFVYTLDEVMEMGKAVSDAELAKVQAQVRPEDPMLGSYTSGTTGTPKIGVQTHMTQFASIKSYSIRARITENDRVIQLLPLNTALSSCPLKMGLVYGSATLLMEFFNPKACVELVQQEKATFIIGAPAVYNTIVMLPDIGKYDLSSLRAGGCAGAMMPPDTLRKCLDPKYIGFKEFYNWYAQTEGAWCGIPAKPGDSVDRLAEWTGVPIAPYFCKMVNPVTGEEMPRGQEGEMWSHSTYGRGIDGDGIGEMKEYYNMPEKTAAKRDKDGWMHTGDLAIMDKDWYIKITGRTEDLILVGGQNVYPAVIEDFVRNLPQVREVVVFNVPHHRLGEVPMAAVVLKEEWEGKTTEYEIMHEIEKGIARWNVPHYVRFVKYEELPQTASGKLQKFPLSGRFVKELGLEKVAKESGWVPIRK